METRSEQLLRETAAVLEHNILDYWLTLRDPRGGFYGEVPSSGEIQPDAPRGVILNARIIWSFAAACRQLGKPAYLAAAEAAGQAAPGILERQLGQDFAANEKEIRKGCDWGGKRNSKGRTDFWLGYKLHVVTGDGDVPLACLLSSASLHDSQAAFERWAKEGEAL